MTNEEMWAGKLGDEYTVRNKIDVTARMGFWQPLLKMYKPNRILEVGCNQGANLCAIACTYTSKLYGIDVNADALWRAKKSLKGISTTLDSATDIPFKDDWFDLVFTAGCLIHIPPEKIKKAMQEIIRVSNKYILCIEYYAQQERERPFLGEMGITWERPWNDLWTAMGLKIVEAGFLTKDQGFNDLNYWMFEKEE